MDMLRSASEWISNQRKQFLSVSVTYIHYDGGTASSQTLTATIGRSLFRADQTYGVTIRVHSVDFIIRSADISFEPSKGDEIVYSGHRYEVLAPNDEPVWRYSGNCSDSIRIHTKDMGEYDA